MKNNIDVYLDLINRGAVVECDTTSGWVRITNKEHLVKAIETDCILRVVPSDSVNALEIALALNGVKR